MKGFALRFLMAQSWAVSGDILEVMAGLSARDLVDLDVSAFSNGKGWKPQMVAARKGVMTQQGVEMRGSVAVIPVQGVISQYAGMFEDICGGTSTQTLARRIQSAMDDPRCSSVVMVFDTPGGEARGINEISAMIHEASKKKPIKAYVSGMACSAGYWMASACGEIVVDAMADLGSLGTVMGFRFRKESDGVQSLKMISSQSPYKQIDPRTEEGKEKYQESLDAMSDVFIDSVAKYRSVSREKVLADFGQGWVLMGQKAVDAGMADRLGSFEGLITEMNKGRNNEMTTKIHQSAPTIGQAVSLSLSAETSIADAVTALSEALPDVVASMVGESEAPKLAASGVSMFLSEQSEEVQAAFASHFKPEGETPKMALDNAAEVVAMCGAAGLSASVAEFLKPGMTMAQVKEKTTMASDLSDVLSAAGLTASLASVIAVSDNPAQMVAVAIQEAKALNDSDTEIEQETPVKASASAIDSDEIYARRNK